MDESQCRSIVEDAARKFAKAELKKKGKLKVRLIKRDESKPDSNYWVVFFEEGPTIHVFLSRHVRSVNGLGRSSGERSFEIVGRKKNKVKLSPRKEECALPC